DVESGILPTPEPKGKPKDDPKNDLPVKKTEPEPKSEQPPKKQGPEPVPDSPSPQKEKVTPENSLPKTEAPKDKSSEEGTPKRENRPPKEGNRGPVAERDVKLDAKVGAALTWLVQNQQLDGGWAPPGVINPAENPVTASLCGLALMASGGKYQVQVARAAAYVE